ncbi:hydrogenase maturation nickel metallochaperone HypA [Sulfuracidifex metallicus]|uniref:hydrogenase maturation nickel metallochaperone HypA/HybF n=1 Tax=Sulfuracidifex metallicus TaxID=47303 RepID=UPI0022747B97|nr:hydrogenase maturation nickel metallochaperone HypA [Sulfuracidifex metallicus]MCY0850235.1 hydrogenase maturation nickel metallochaperone HypA [Sulfuracidifex metallicus]
MHEWSVADGIVRTVSTWAKENNFSEITMVKVGIPSFTFLEVDILREAFNEIKKGTPLDNSTLEVEFLSASFKCRNCGNSFSEDQVKEQLDSVRSEFGEEYPLHLMPALSPSFLSCIRCGSHDLIVEVQDIMVKEVEVKDHGTIKTVS